MLGIDWADVEGKYRALAPYARSSAECLEASLDVMRNLRCVEHVSELTELLR